MFELEGGSRTVTVVKYGMIHDRIRIKRIAGTFTSTRTNTVHSHRLCQPSKRETLWRARNHHWGPCRITLADRTHLAGVRGEIRSWCENGTGRNPRSPKALNPIAVRHVCSTVR